jgi:maleamate amidohydrolase
MAERVWDKYLSEQDKAHLALKPRKPKPVGNRPALLLIDLYRSVFGYEPKSVLDAVEEWPSSCGLAAWEALPHIQKLLATAREVGIPVFHTTGLDGDYDHWGDSARQGRDRTEPSEDELRRRKERYQIIPEVAPLSGETVVRKASPSCFWGTPLIGQLTYLGVDTLVVGGESTSGCVRAAVTDGCTYRFKMMVAEECVFDRHEATHAMNLFDMHQKSANVVPVAEAMAYLHTWHEGQNAAKPAGQDLSATV